VHVNFYINKSNVTRFLKKKSEGGGDSRFDGEQPLAAGGCSTS